MTAVRRLSWRHAVEILLLLLIVAGLGETVHRFIYDGHLPQPFIFDVNDTFMDWYNTAWYAHNHGAFNLWRTVYPPISFVFLRLVGIHSCYYANSMTARDCDYFGVITLLASYVAACLLAYASFRRHDRRTAVVRGLAFGLGLPMLFTLERGNLIIPCMIFFILAHGGLVRSRLLRGLTAAISINFKPYLVLPVLAQAVRRNWRPVELAGLASVLVYLVTFAAYGGGSPAEMIANTANWVQFGKGMLWEGVYYTTSYMPFLELNTFRFPASAFISSRLIDFLTIAIPLVVRTSQLVGVAALIGTWLQPQAVGATRIAILLMVASLVGQSPGGYTETFLIFLMFLERYDRRWPMVALVMAYLLSVPYDYVFTNVIELYGDSWLSGRTVTAPFGFSLGIFGRPGLLIVILWSLSIDTLIQVVAAHRSARPRFGLAPRTGSVPA